MLELAFDRGDAAAEVVDAGEAEDETEPERRLVCETGLTELGEERRRAVKSTGD